MRRFYNVLRIACIAALAISLIALGAVLAYVLINGADKLSVHLLFGEYRSSSPTVLPAFVGTLELVLIASALSVPVGIACAVFLVEYTNRRSKFVRLVQLPNE